MDGKRKTGIAELAFCCFIFLAGCAAGTAISTAFAPGQDIKTSAPEQLDRLTGALVKIVGELRP